ncbi:Choline/carnitine acyltransferase domain-containing protein [Caenorhabditis elegans]|uniref:Choline/carnitine acyltransferase domain-containing protein n=1 Tax=Caenorhabditis elegans TaxID=6239 RepID=Q9N3N3_CAEEL|nr:Choline/carnitine acyltransferase domain-containing protein [Caenorhabditis elegans]CCD67073.1 Choline/carnitine acyltransferase domain-containing protein [Caenorhabditis elegans]|eukprot:NP_497498.2 Carnitine Palmitoyl Transferase [Caenorhabditis elegans]
MSPSLNKKLSAWPYPRLERFPGRLERFRYRTYNFLENRLWPVRPIYFLALVALITGYGFPQDLLKSFFISYSLVFLLRHILKYTYFSYKGYLKESPKKPSYATIVWGTVKKILSHVAPPQLSSCDRLLSNLPLPRLEDTVTRYTDSMKFVISEEEHNNLIATSTQFLSHEGRTLQRFAWLLHLITDNYVTWFWEKYIYYAGRYPLPIISSTCQCVLYGEDDLTQVYQVARLLYIETLANLSVDRQDYLAVGDGLMSTRHYRNIYNGSRVPGAEIDNFQWNPPSRHALVVHKGTWYKVDTCDEDGRLYSVNELAKIVSELTTRQDKSTGFLCKISSLTADRRTEWSKNRRKFFLNNAHNKKLLEVIETSQYVISMDTAKWGVETSDKMSVYMKDMLAGDGTNRWFDKTMNYAICANGRGGATGEHSPADGAEMDHVCENFLNLDKQILKSPSKEEQLEIAKLDEPSNYLKLAEKLEFEVEEGLEEEVERCYEAHTKAVADLHVHSIIFLDFGKGRLKKCGISPDGFVQMAIQLAYFEDQGKFTQTYETGSIRFYANSRTETVRPVTSASCKLVCAMLDETSSKQTRRQLLKEACEVHVNNCKEVMLGNGFDRHLFVLCVIAKGLGYNSPFLDFFSSQKWLLSTSNIPNMTNSIAEDTSVNNIMLGGSFGAVAQDGYGICYRFGGNHAILVHITSYHSSELTDSERIGNRLKSAFHRLAGLFDD